MSARTSYSIAVLPGDGIGPEVTAPCLTLLDKVSARHGFALDYRQIAAGAQNYLDTGVSISRESFAASAACDAILLGAMGLPHVRYPGGTEVVPQIELREEFQLYAGVRPIRTQGGWSPALSDARAGELDCVLIRESTEGLFAARGKTRLDGDEAAHDTMTITRVTSEKLFDFAFTMARQRKAEGKPGKVTLIDKANVLGALAFMRKIFLERAEHYPDIETECAYVDAMALNLVKRPWDYDVMVTENMFGDILSDLGAALMGGMGFAPSADIGDDVAVFQPCHGTAPDIVGQGKANPIAMILSGAMMLDWLGRKHGDERLCVAAGELESATGEGLASLGDVPFEMGGRAGTQDILNAVEQAL